MADQGQQVTFASNGREAHGYLVTPPGGGGGPGVIVIQEWWGLTDHIRDVSERFANEGFVALAPDLFGGRTTHDSDEAGKMMQELPVEQAATDLSGAVDYLLSQDGVTGDRVGAVGFCMGGGFVLLLASQLGDRVGAAVPFYPVGPVEGDMSGITAPVLGHAGTDDDFASAEEYRALEQKVRDESGTEVNFHLYEGAGHAFFNDENTLGTYNAEYADQVWQRTLEFLRANL